METTAEVAVSKAGLPGGGPISFCDHSRVPVNSLMKFVAPGERSYLRMLTQHRTLFEQAAPSLP